MIKVENIDVWGFEHAIRGMRNPKNSWDKSDSVHTLICDECTRHLCDKCKELSDEHGIYEVIGPNDLKLARSLYQGGPEHRKFMRQIFVSMDIIAPLYLWKEMDQYRIGVTTDSCSTMHTIHKKEFTLDDFSVEHLIDKEMNSIEGDPESVFIEMQEGYSMDVMRLIIDALNNYRQLFLKTKDKKYWWQMIQLLPSSYNQKRTVTMNYENAVNMIRQRENHKLDEWREFVKVLRGLPYLEEIMGDKK